MMEAAMTDFERYFEALRGKNIAVLGLGVSNRPLVRLLLEFGCNVTGCDRTPGRSWTPRCWNWSAGAVH